jgi:NAD(P)-dependent dehydrogenase (short-subunit alcohol dehydrogenase family)
MKTVLITGAAGGLGRRTAEYLAARDFRVYGADLKGAIASAPELEGVTWVELDVTDPASIEAAVAKVREGTSGLDAVVNFAGILAVGSMIELPIETVQRVVDVNVFGTYRVNRAFFPLLRERLGRVVNISSETGWQSGGPFNGAYALSKHAIEAYSDSLRRELMLLGMKVVKIQPGPFKTEMVRGIDASFRRAIESSALFKEVLEKVRSLAVREEGKANDPELLAATVHRALTAKSPKAAYSVRADLARSALEYVPTALADRLLKSVLD